MNGSCGRACQKLHPDRKCLNKKPLRVGMNHEWLALVEEDGRAYLLQRGSGEVRVRGLGRFNVDEMLGEVAVGDNVKIGQKILRVLKPGLPEARRSMKRRAQIILAKDSGYLISRMGISVGSRVLEGGHGSAGLAMHIASVLGSRGTLISVENRPEHASVGKENMDVLKDVLPEFPDWHLLHSDVAECHNEVLGIVPELDAAILDMAEPWKAVSSISGILRPGGRIGCYCPTSVQLERSWEACEEAGLSVEWAGEVIERRWSKASRGGVRPGNQPVGHTAFLLIGVNLGSLSEM